MSLFDCVVLALVILAVVWYRWYTFPSSIKKIVESTRPDNDPPGTYHYGSKLENCTDGKAHPDTGFPTIDSTTNILPLNISPSYMSIYNTPMKDRHKGTAAKDSVSKKKKAKKKTKKKTSKEKNK